MGDIIGDISTVMSNGLLNQLLHSRFVSLNQSVQSWSLSRHMGVSSLGTSEGEESTSICLFHVFSQGLSDALGWCAIAYWWCPSVITIWESLCSKQPSQTSRDSRLFENFGEPSKCPGLSSFPLNCLTYPICLGANPHPVPGYTSKGILQRPSGANFHAKGLHRWR